MIQATSTRVVGKAIGNAVSENIVERLLCRLLPAAGLTEELDDFWHGIAPLPKTQAWKHIERLRAGDRQ